MLLALYYVYRDFQHMPHGNLAGLVSEDKENYWAIQRNRLITDESNDNTKNNENKTEKAS